MPASEFEEWYHYYHVQPFGSKRGNMHAAIIAATIRNIYRPKGARPIDWKDFLFVPESEHREAALKSGFSQLAAMAVPKKQAKREAKRRRKQRDRSRKAGRKA